jgi:hypothetical protein
MDYHDDIALLLDSVVTTARVLSKESRISKASTVLKDI